MTQDLSFLAISPSLKNNELCTGETTRTVIIQICKRAAGTEQENEAFQQLQKRKKENQMRRQLVAEAVCPGQ